MERSGLFFVHSSPRCLPLFPSVRSVIESDSARYVSLGLDKWQCICLVLVVTAAAANSPVVITGSHRVMLQERQW